MRWVASLVAETHRILTRGGVFLYPADDRQGYERGRLRLLYECAPIAFLVDPGRRRGDRRRRSDPEPDRSRRCTSARPSSSAAPRRWRASPPITTCPTPKSRRFSASAACSGADAMSKKHPIISVTGSSGAGTSTVKTPSTRSSAAKASRPSRSRATPSTGSTAPTCAPNSTAGAADGDMTFSHFSYEANELGELERVFRDYGETGKGRTRTYVHDEIEAARTGMPPGQLHRLGRRLTTARICCSTRACTARWSTTRSTSPRSPTSRSAWCR